MNPTLDPPTDGRNLGNRLMAATNIDVNKIRMPKLPNFMRNFIIIGVVFAVVVIVLVIIMFLKK